MKKTILLFVFDGFADWSTSYAMAEIMKMSAYRIKTIALDKTILTTAGGLTVFPDLDFRPEIDLVDIDAMTTALVILPGGDAWRGNRNTKILLLIDHCLHHQIPIAGIGSAAHVLNERYSFSNGLRSLEKNRNFNEHTCAIIAQKNILTREMTQVEFSTVVSEVLRTTEVQVPQGWPHQIENMVRANAPFNSAIRQVH